MVIGLSGEMGSGKDTVADRLAELIPDLVRVSFAHALREELDDYISNGLADDARGGVWPFCQFCEDEALYTSLANAARSLTSQQVWLKPTSPAARILLQWWGTEFRRRQDRDYWIKALRPQPSDAFDMVITDVRYANEAAKIRSVGGVVWRVVRASSPKDGLNGHASERLEFDPDLVINNNGTLRDLFNAVDRCLPSGLAAAV